MNIYIFLKTQAMNILSESLVNCENRDLQFIFFFKLILNMFRIMQL